MPSSTIFPVVLCYERGLDKRQADDVAAIFERHPGPITVNVRSRSIELKKNGPEESLIWSDTFAALQELREAEKIPVETFVCLLTKSSNEENWYAVQNPESRRSGFIHVGDFSWVTSAPSHFISAHYVLKGAFNFLLQEATD